MFSNRYGEGGAVGKYTDKSFIPKSKFENVFYIRKSYRRNIHNVRKIHLLALLIQRLWGKSLEISTNFLWVPFSKFDWWVHMTKGFNPYFFLGLNIFFLRYHDCFSFLMNQL